MIGSEGLLGVITKAVLKLVPLKSEELLMLAAFDNAESAAICVNKILLNGFLPAGIELMEKSGVEIVLNQQQYNFPTPETAEFFLMIILDGNDQVTIADDVEPLTVGERQARILLNEKQGHVLGEERIKGLVELLDQHRCESERHFVDQQQLWPGHDGSPER